MEERVLNKLIELRDEFEDYLVSQNLATESIFRYIRALKKMTDEELENATLEEIKEKHGPLAVNAVKYWREFLQVKAQNEGKVISFETLQSPIKRKLTKEEKVAKIDEIIEKTQVTKEKTKELADDVADIIVKIASITKKMMKCDNQVLRPRGRRDGENV